MKVGIIAIFKNEFPYILEWIAYHRLIGINQFYIADNISDDGSSQLLEALDQAGIITRIFFPRIGEAGPQMPAYNHILHKYGGEVDLMAFIDADEFICIKGFESIQEVLAPMMQDSTIAAMGINWRVFGSSQHVFPPKGLVIENYIHHSLESYDNNRHIKSIVKPSYVKRMHVHEAKLKRGRFVNSNLNDIEFDETGAKTKAVCHDNLIIHHYVVKSRIDHFINKSSKGSAAGLQTRKKGEAYFKSHDKKELTSIDLHAYYQPVKQLIATFKEQLLQQTQFMQFASGHIHIQNNQTVVGWVSTENNAPVKVKLIVGQDEYIIDVNLKRPDVFKKKLSKVLECGFRKKLPVAINAKEQVAAFSYGSMSQLKISRN